MLVAESQLSGYHRTLAWSISSSLEKHLCLPGLVIGLVLPWVYIWDGGDIWTSAGDTGRG